MKDKPQRGFPRAGRTLRGRDARPKRTAALRPRIKAKTGATGADEVVKRPAAQKSVAAKPAALKSPAAQRGAKAAAKVKAKARIESAQPKGQPRPRLKAVKAPKRVLRKPSKPQAGVALARFSVGDVVRHKFYPFRGVIFDIDPVFANTEDWWLSIPEQMRPKKNQPFYHLLAENAETEYIAYVSEQNLLPDTTGVPVRHPQVTEYFVEEEDGRYRPVFMTMLN